MKIYAMANLQKVKLFILTANLSLIHQIEINNNFPKHATE
jgi:hypothetical protein